MRPLRPVNLADMGAAVLRRYAEGHLKFSR